MYTLLYLMQLHMEATDVRVHTVHSDALINGAPA